jgi:hypothetical protein
MAGATLVPSVHVERALADLAFSPLPP